MASNSASVSGSDRQPVPFASRRHSASSGSARSSSSDTNGSARTGATVTQSQRGSSGLLAGVVVLAVRIELRRVGLGRLDDLADAGDAGRLGVRVVEDRLLAPAHLAHEVARLIAADPVPAFAPGAHEVVVREDVGFGLEQPPRHAPTLRVTLSGGKPNQHESTEGSKWLTLSSSTPAARRAESASRGRARSRTCTRSTSRRPCCSALVDRNGFDTADVDDVIWGTSSQVCEQSGDLGRMAALDAGYDVRASGVTLDRFCGSGITANNFAAAMVMAGQEDLVIGGGTEMMSLPKKGLLPMGAGNAHLQEIHPQSHQGVCADAIASLEGIDRTALDAHAAESQRRAADRDQGRALRPEPGARAQPRRQPRARPRGVPASGHDRRVARRAGAQLPGGRRPPLRRRRAHLPRAHQPAVPRPRDHARPPRRQLVGRRRRRGGRALRERGLRAARTG